MQIQTVLLQDIGPFERLELSFKSGFNLICGPNGVGKSTILSALSEPFSGGYGGSIKRRAASDMGIWRVSVANGSQLMAAERSVSAFHPEQRDADAQLVSLSPRLINIRTGRELNYQKLQAIPADEDRNLDQSSQAAQYGLRNQDLKGWLAQRWVFSQIPGSLNQVQLENFRSARLAFTALSENVKLESVQPGTFEVIVSTSEGEFPFEYLSSGYKSSIYIILGIIKEIEVRRLDVSASEFDGCILIDEIDLHLHPTWQQAIVPVLKHLFPEAQFIATTHSPHVVQIAGPGEVIALGYGEKGLVEARMFEEMPCGFGGWSVEEILTDVMGLESTYSPHFRTRLREFEEALEEEDSVTASQALAELDRMLHPTSYLRKLLRIEAAGIVPPRQVSPRD